MQVKIQEYLNGNTSRENSVTILLLKKLSCIKRKNKKTEIKNKIKKISFRGA